MDVGLAFGGALFIESVYGLPGIGYVLYRALSRSDRMVIMGIVLIVSVSVAIANLLADLAHALLDPRVRGHTTREATASEPRRREVSAQARVTESPT
jgi:peptide/nickel transport system permease protein